MRQSHNSNRISVFLDGEFAFGLASAAAVGLEVGQKLSPNAIQSLLRRETVEKGKKSALRFISVRPRSEAEVRRNLLGKGYDADIIETIVENLRSIDLLNDEQFACYWVEQRETFRPRSRRALQAELFQKGVSARVIDSAISGIDERRSARQAAAKQARRWRDLPQDLFRVKLGNYLQRRGFHYGIINDVTSELWQVISEDGLTERDRAKEGN